MSQNYSCIITKEEIVLPKELPHFKEKDITYIPLDVYSQFVREFIERFQNGCINYDLTLIIDPYWETVKKRTIYHDPKDIFALIEDLGLTFKEFALYHASDWGAPIEEHEGLFRDGNLVPDIKFISNEWDTFETVIGSKGIILPHFGLNWDTLLTYGDYDVAARVYKHQQSIQQ